MSAALFHEAAYRSLLAFGLLLAVAVARPAAALPSFADQTSQPCTACHIGGFGPQLTPYGRQFKLEAFTARANDKAIPFSAMVTTSAVRTTKDQAAPPAPRFSTNNNAALDEGSLFLATGIGSHLGAFVQTTYNGIDRTVAWDNMDLRAVTPSLSLGNSDVLLGLSLNNSPSVQDAWNTLPAWGFPFTSSDLAPSPVAAPLISGALGQNSLGLSAYAWIDSQAYAEFGLYKSVSRDFLSMVGTGIDGTSLIKGAAPYFRFAYQKTNADIANFQLGAFGLFAETYPDRDMSSGLTDTYRDIGIDASYQRFDGLNTFTFNSRLIREDQQQDATRALGDVANRRNTLYDARANASYYWNNTVGLTVGAFRTWGSSDSALYAANSTLKPNSSGLVFQIDGTPFGSGNGPLSPYANLRIGLQYTVYATFNGASRNYDGSGRNASDNNTLRLFAWFAF